MSAATRQALADAASTVADVNVTPYVRKTVQPGDGWIRLERVTYPNKFGGVTQWQVRIVIPQDLRRAEEWLDEHLPELVAALNTQMTVTSAEPFTTQAPNQASISVIVIAGTRETE